MLLVLSSACFFSGCHSTKKTAVISTTDISNIFDYLITKQADFKSLNINNVTISININNQPVSAKGFIKLIKDSTMLMSIQLFPGLEMARMQITPDSIVVLDRINSQYYITNAKEFKKITGIEFDFNIIQGLLSNQLFLAGTQKPELSKEMFNAAVFPPESYEIKTNENSLSFDHIFIINKFQELEKTILTDKINPYSLICEYENFAKEGRINFPHKIAITTINGRQQQRIEFNISKVEFDSPMNMSFSIPVKYSKGNIENFKF